MSVNVALQKTIEKLTKTRVKHTHTESKHIKPNQDNVINELVKIRSKFFVLP
jgi:hypothetical protein